MAEGSGVANAELSRRAVLKSLAGGVFVGTSAWSLTGCGDEESVPGAESVEEAWRSVTVNLDAKRFWDAAVSRAGGGKMNGLIIGSSTAEGAVARPWTARFSTRLEKSIQSALSSDDSGHGGYVIRARDSAWAIGGMTSESALDLGLRNRILLGGSSLTHSTVQPVTGIRVLFVEGPGSSPFDVIVDGERSFRVTPSVDKPANSATGWWESPSLARRPHQFRIVSHGSISLGNTVFRDQDRDSGFTMYQGGHAGWPTIEFLKDSSASMWDRFSTIQPKIVLVCLGTNDRGIGTGPEQFEQDVRSLIKRINLRSETVPWIVLIAQHNTSPRGPGPWPAYMDAMRAIASTSPNVTYTSFFEFFPQVPGEFNDPGDLLGPDDTHLSTSGHVRAAEILSRQLGFPSPPVWPV